MAGWTDQDEARLMADWPHLRPAPGQRVGVEGAAAPEASPELEANGDAELTEWRERPGGDEPESPPTGADILEGETPPKPEDNGKPKAKRQRKRQAPQPEGAPNLLKPDGQTDAENAKRFAKAFGQDVRYCPPWKRFLIWDRVRWSPDQTGEAVELAKQIGRDLMMQALRFLDKEAIKFAVRTNNRRGIDDLLKLAQSEPPLPILTTALNSDPMLLCCPNGIVDLRTGRLREHRRKDYITTLCPTPFEEDACCPRWLEYLSGIFAHSESLISFWKCYCGYALSGDVREDIVAILHGNGSNGKTVMVNTLARVWGPDYFMQAAPTLLLSGQRDRHPTELADLFGKRFVAAIENDQDRNLAEGIVKSATGGDRIRARHCFKDFFEFQTTAKIALCTNHKPEVKGTDDGIWRRIALVPFAVRFWDEDKGETGPPHLKADKDLESKLHEEACGILRWAVEGALQWQRDGLKLPTEVKDATAEYRTEQDTLLAFLEEKTIQGPEYRVRASALYDVYNKWAKHSAMTSTKFGREIKKRFKWDKSNTVWYLGIALIDEEHSP